MSDDSRKAMKDKGLKIRREVLGSKHVDASMDKANPFNAEMQQLLNEYCWGATWGREVLTRKERSLLNLGMLTALGRQHEVAVHVRGARPGQRELGGRGLHLSVGQFHNVRRHRHVCIGGDFVPHHNAGNGQLPDGA